MKIKLRLYKYHDPELVQIYRLETIDFEKLTLDCLTAFSKNEIFRYLIDWHGTLKPAKRVYQLSINIDEKEHPEIIEVLKKADDGCMNVFIKTILKWYLSDPMPSILLKNEADYDYFNKKCSKKFKDINSVPYKEEVIKKKRNNSKTKESVKTEKKESENPINKNVEKSETIPAYKNDISKNKDDVFVKENIQKDVVAAEKKEPENITKPDAAEPKSNPLKEPVTERKDSEEMKPVTENEEQTIEETGYTYKKNSVFLDISSNDETRSEADVIPDSFINEPEEAEGSENNTEIESEKENDLMEMFLSITQN